MKIELVYGVASCIYSFRPNSLRRLVLSKHYPYHVDERSFLTFYYTILLKPFFISLPFCLSLSSSVLTIYLVRRKHDKRYILPLPAMDDLPLSACWTRHGAGSCVCLIEFRKGTCHLT
jgi:hypothetical protein